MKSFIKRLFSRSVTFGNDMKNCVNVLKSVPLEKKSINLYNGFIKSINFDERIVYIINSDDVICRVPFDDIVTISRMDDKRLRMWIKKED